MHRSLAVSVACLAALGAACSSRVAPSNPYDPATPPEQQARGQVRGALLVSGAGAAVDVTVFLRENGEIVRQTATAADGAFLFDAVVPGSYVLEASPTGFVPLSLPLAVAAGEQIDTGQMALTAASAASVIEGTATLAGEVDAGGTLVEAVGRAYTAVTNSQGRYHLAVPEGAYLLRLSHKDFVTLTLPEVTVARGESRVLDAVTLPANPATISGHVDAELAAGGAAPLADATVTLEGTALTGLTNAAGDFALTGVPPGGYLLRVIKEGYSQATAPVLGLAGGEARALAEPFSLALLRGGLRGSVTLADTADASGVVVEVAGTSRAAVTGADGVFAFDGLLTGPYTLSAHKDGYTRRDLGSWTVAAGAVTAVAPVPPAVLTPVGGAVTVAEGAFVNVRGVHLAVAAGGGFYRAAEHPQPLPAAWTAVPAGGQIPFQLSDADGQHVIDVVFSADGVTAGAPTSAAVVLDRQRPTSPSVVIGDGSGYSRASEGIVSLALSALDLPPTAGAAVAGVSRMQLSSDAAFSAPETRDYALTATWTLAAPATDGPRTVYVRFLDRAGNVSDAASASVVLDRHGPTDPSLTLAGPAGSPDLTTSAAVTATLAARDDNGPLLVRLSNTPGFEGARYQPLSSPAAWTLLPGDGPKEVWAQFMDPAGNESGVVSRTITLDSAGPSSPVVALTERDVRPLDGYTNVLTVDLALSAGGSPTAAQLSVDPSFATGVVVVSMDGRPQPVAAAYTLGGAGAWTIYARFQDLAGNWSATAASRPVTVDVSAPRAPAVAVHGSLGGGAPSTTWTTTPAVTASFSATEDAVEVAVSQSSGTTPCALPAAPTWYPLSAAFPLTLQGSDGNKTVCAITRDAAGNVSPPGSAAIELDTTPPSNPSFRDLVSGYTRALRVTGTLVAAAADPGHTAAGAVAYQCYTSTSGIWSACTPSATLGLAFDLTSNASNVVGVRAVDAAGNASAGTLISLVQDAVAPFLPNITDVRTTADSLSLTWSPGVDTDIDHFLVYYGTAPGDLAGTGAGQGASPLRVAGLGGAQSLALTGLTPGVRYYVAVEAVDRAGNGSGPSGQRSAIPARVNPRLLSSLGGQPRALAVIAGVAAGAGRTFAYVAENQGMVQLDVTDDASAPVATGRAALPDLAPDAPPLAFTCSRAAAGGGVEDGHCLVVVGSTLEGAERQLPDAYRAPTPVVFFPMGGTSARPVLGEIVTVLPTTAGRAVAATVGGLPVVLAAEQGRVLAFDLARVSAPRLLASVQLPVRQSGVRDATVVGSGLFVYGPAQPSPLAAPQTAVLQRVELGALASGALTATSLGTLQSDDGVQLGDPLLLGASVQPAFGDGIYLAYAAPSRETRVCGFDVTVSPVRRTCATACGVSNMAPMVRAAAWGNGHVYAFDFSGNDYGCRVNAAGGAVTGGATAIRKPDTSDEARAAAAVAVYGGTEHVLTLSLFIDQWLLERWSGPSLAHAAAPWYELSSGTYVALSDGIAVVSASTRLWTIDLSNPLLPRVLAQYTGPAGRRYGRIVVRQGRVYVGLTSLPSGFVALRLSPDGALTEQAVMNEASAVNALALAGRTLFVATTTELQAWSLADPAAPEEVVSLGVPGGVAALAARASSGLDAYRAVVYTARESGPTPAFRAYGYDGRDLTALGSDFAYPGDMATDITVQGPLAVVSSAYGATVLDVSWPQSPRLVRAGVPVAGPALFQGGYLVGAGVLNGVGGPVFATYTDAAGGPKVEAAVPFSGCNGDGLAHESGTYAAACGTSGLALYAVADPQGGRLLKGYSLAPKWADSAALAIDGAYVAIGGVGDAAGGTAGLYVSDEESNAAGTPAPPSLETTVSLPASSPFAAYLVGQDGSLFSFQQTSVGAPTLVAYEFTNPWGAWPVRATLGLSGSAKFTAQPVSDGGTLYVGRSVDAGASTVEQYDAREPSILRALAPARAAWADRPVTALCAARGRLYVGSGGGGQLQVLDATSTALPGFTAVPVDAATTRSITGIAVSGRWLFYTFEAAAPGAYGLRVVRLATATRDGAAAAEPDGVRVVGELASAVPLASPRVAGDTLFVSAAWGLVSYDLTPLWRTGAMPVPAGAVATSDRLISAYLGRLLVEGPFAYLASGAGPGGTYRVFDLR